MLADTHCHLNFAAFDGDRAQVLARAWEAGVERLLNPGIDLISSQDAVELAGSNSQVYAAVGVHPNSALTWEGDTQAQLRTLATSPKVVAIGEIGLDYYRDRAPRELQRLVFQEQIDLASELGLPVIIHNRQATEDTFKILVDWHAGLVAAGSSLAERPGVLHSYSDREEPALRAIDMGFYIGFSGPVTFHNARDLQRVAGALPLDRMLIETDAPFLTPHPYRGKRNEPAHVTLVAKKITELHNNKFSKIARVTTANATRLFHW